MRTLLVHPSALMHSELFLRLEPLGLERVGSAILAAGHPVRMVDLQVYSHQELWRCFEEFDPDAVAFSVNYLANIPEVLDLAKSVKARKPTCTVFAGGHSISFIAEHVLEQAAGAIDAVVRGEGEDAAAEVVRRVAERDGGRALLEVPGIVTVDGAGPPPRMAHDLDSVLPARDIGGRRRRYFIGVLDPAASVEFSRGCPWDCSFCSAWTFYGRSYRRISAEAAAEDVARVREPGVFLVDDVAFIKPEHGFEIGRAIEKRGVRKEYYLETRCDVLVRNEEVFRYWRRLGLEYMFLGIESLSEEGLKAFRKRSSADTNARALEVARKLGVTVAINIIADPDWDEAQFERVRQWALEVPEIVHLTVQTPYPGTEIWSTESRRLTTLDYRLFDVQHAVLPTRLPLDRFYAELVKTQAVLARKHLGVAALLDTAKIAAHHLLHGQTNFVRMLWKFSGVYNARRLLEDHWNPVHYQLPEPPAADAPGPERNDLYVHVPLRVSRHGPPARVGPTP
ncbi:MAG TPA: hopanoid C-3 methylase HpnR [Acidimicrobiales bacterium]|nr:hopanoid C-3 methylase HpnR [Acidimicrobiales bacterium]